MTIIDFGGPKLFFEDRGLVDGKTAKVTNEFYTDEGVIKGGKFYPKGKKRRRAAQGRRVDPSSRRAVRQLHRLRPQPQSATELNAEILEGHLSSLLCHLGNVSYRLGAKSPSARRTKAFGDDKAAYEAFDSMKQHLADAAKLNSTASTYRLGRKLDFDAKAEEIRRRREANKLLTRPYRQPFVVPEQV